MHRMYANIGPTSYKFKFPPNQNVIDAIIGGQKRKRKDDDRPFIGMNPLVGQQANLTSILYNGNGGGQGIQTQFIFDSKFESGNLDMAIKIRETEYDLYMRVDSNTRGHHQWFYFSVQNQKFKGKVKFNIVNFTKRSSLYSQGMRLNVYSQKEADLKSSQPNFTSFSNDGWTKGCENIIYKSSKLNQLPPTAKSEDEQIQHTRQKKYFQLSFEYEFKQESDKVFFSYSVPYTFTKLYNFLKQTVQMHQDFQLESQAPFIKETQLCKSLSGLEVPLLIVTSRANKSNFEEIDPTEFQNQESLPINKYKKQIIVCSRVHPGESNASYIMQGFIKFITSPTNPEAVELRKKIIFRIVPMTNPDGVIVGNYRVSLSGNDLNRQFITPDARLHPCVCAIKEMIQNIIQNAKEPDPISAFIDIHGHSRKKSIFIYGPYFPLHNEKYLKMRVLPQLLSERTDMFRFYSCKFRIQKSKLKAARVVLWKEFNIMNCFTLEASFHGFIDKDRCTVELTTEMFEKMGEYLGQGFGEYQSLVEEDEKQHLILKQQIKNKKKKMNAKDLVTACSKQQEQIFKINNNQPNQENNNFQHSYEQYFSSEYEDALKSQKQVKTNQVNSTTGRSTSSLSTKQNQSILPKQSASSEAESTYDARTTHQKLSQRAQSFNVNKLQTQSVKPYFEQVPSNQKRDSSFSNSRPEMVLEAKRSSAEQSDLSQKYNKDTLKMKEIKEIDNSKKRKPVRLKKLPHQQESQSNTEKRTLKSIYKLLKRDMKRFNCGQGERQGVGNGGQEHAGIAQQMMGGNESSDDEDEDNEDSCGKSMSEDDLPQTDLLELQSDIINAIDKFDKFFNNKKPQEAQSKGQKDQRKQKSKKKEQTPVQILDLDKGVRDFSELMPTVLSAKHETNSKNDIRSKGSFIIKGSKKNQKQQTILKMSKINRSDQPSQNQTFVAVFSNSNQGYIQNLGEIDSKRNLGVGMSDKVNQGKIQSSVGYENISGEAGRIAQKQSQKVAAIVDSQQSIIKSNNANSQQVNQDGNMYQLISHNIKNLIKQKYSIGYSQKGQQSGQGQVLHQSKSQDRCSDLNFPQSSAYHVESGTTKSFEELQLHGRQSQIKAKYQCNFNKETASIPQNLETFIKNSIYQQKSGIVPYSNQNEIKNGGQIQSSKSSRVTFQGREGGVGGSQAFEKPRANHTPGRVLQQISNERHLSNQVQSSSDQSKVPSTQLPSELSIRNKQPKLLTKQQQDYNQLLKERAEGLENIRIDKKRDLSSNLRLYQNKQSDKYFGIQSLNKTQMGSHNVSSPPSIANENTLGSCSNLDAQAVRSRRQNKRRGSFSKGDQAETEKPQIQTLDVQSSSDPKSSNFLRRNKMTSSNNQARTYYLIPNEASSSHNAYLKLDGSIAPPVAQSTHIFNNSQSYSQNQRQLRLEKGEKGKEKGNQIKNKDYSGFLSDGERDDYQLRNEAKEVSSEHFLKQSLQHSSHLAHSSEYGRKSYGGKEKGALENQIYNEDGQMRKSQHLRSQVASEFHNSITKAQKFSNIKLKSEDDNGFSESKIKKKKKKGLKVKTAQNC